MKKILLLICITFSLAGCSKKHDIAPISKKTGFVTINGKAYATVVIGDQTWTSVNYYGTGGINNGNPTVADTLFGKLYTLSEANGITLPSDWRIPNQYDYLGLLKGIGILVNSTGTYAANGSDCDALMSKSNWIYAFGDNSSGFNAIPTDLNTNNLGYAATFLTTTTDPVTHAYYMFLITNQQQREASIAVIPFLTNVPRRAALRFVKDN